MLQQTKAKKVSLLGRIKAFFERRRQIQKWLHLKEYTQAKYKRTRKAIEKRRDSAESMIAICQGDDCYAQQKQIWTYSRLFAKTDLNELEIRHTVEMSAIEDEITRLQNTPF